jgi:hypothetical protein
MYAHIFSKEWNSSCETVECSKEVKFWQLRALLLSDGSIYGLQKYVMIILGIKLFLQADELITLRLESFDQSLFLVDEDRGPTALCVKIQGKNDLTPFHMVLGWAESEYLEFCPIRHLLYYL